MMKKNPIIVGFMAVLLAACSFTCHTPIWAEQAVDKVARTQVQGKLASTERPVIWMRAGERPEILVKIANYQPVADYSAASAP